MREKGIKMVDIGGGSAHYIGAAQAIKGLTDQEMDLLVYQEHWSSLLKEHSGRLGCSREMITGMGKQRLRISFKILMANVLEKYEIAVEDHKAHREALAEYLTNMRERMYD